MPRDANLLEAIERELSTLRRTGRVPTEVRLGEEAWNLLRREMTYAPFGSGRTVQLRGLPCVLAYGLPEEPGFRITFVEAG